MSKGNNGMRRVSECLPTIVNRGARWTMSRSKPLRRMDEVRSVRGAMIDVLHGSQNNSWWICGDFSAEEVDETDVRR